MTHEIREQKESELEMLDDTIEGLKYLLKQKKKQRKRLEKELLYVLEAEDDSEVDVKKVLVSLSLQKDP